MDFKKQCNICGGNLLSLRENYRYVECGLPNIIVHDLEVFRCTKCSGHGFEVLRIPELHRAIALAVIKKPTKLSGEEVRFLRQVMDWSGRDLAKRMGYANSAEVSRWESGASSLSAQGDRLLRLMIAREWPVEQYSVDDLANIDDEDRAPTPTLIHVALRANRWTIVSG